MLVSAQKRFEFCAASLPTTSFRPATITGHNYTLWLGIIGSKDQSTGMVVNLVDLKALGSPIVAKYDHSDLTILTSGSSLPLVTIASNILRDLRQRIPSTLDVYKLHLADGTGMRVTCSAQDSVLSVPVQIPFRTSVMTSSNFQSSSPIELLRQTSGIPAEIDFISTEANGCLDELMASSMEELATVLETKPLEMAAIQLSKSYSGLASVRLEIDNTTRIEYSLREETTRLHRKYRFSAAHRLVSNFLSSAQNKRLYGKCNRPAPHGHTYEVVVCVNTSSISSDINLLISNVDAVVQPLLNGLDNRYLDRDVPEFSSTPSTGENILEYLWTRIYALLESSLDEVTLYETPNNRFLVNRDILSTTWVNRFSL